MRGDGQGSNAPPQPRRDPSENRHRDATEGGAHERRSMRASPAPGIPGLFFTVLRRRTHADAHGAHAGAPGAPVSRGAWVCRAGFHGVASLQPREERARAHRFHFISHIPLSFITCGRPDEVRGCADAMVGGRRRETRPETHAMAPSASQDAGEGVHGRHARGRTLGLDARGKINDAAARCRRNYDASSSSGTPRR